MANNKETVENLIKIYEEKVEEVKNQSLYLNNVVEGVAEIEENLSGLKTKLTKFNNEIDIDIETVRDNFDFIKNIHDSIKIINEDITTKKISLETIEKNSNLIQKNIEKIKKESEEFKIQIGKILDLVSNTGLANSFDTRRKRVNTSMYLWGGIMISTVIITACFLIFGLDIKQYLNNYVALLLRLSLTSPLVFMIWYSAIQYSRERFILEQYEFKNAAALAIENYSKLLNDKFPDDYEKEKFDLIKSYIDKIYQEPQFVLPSTYNRGRFGVTKLFSGHLEVNSEEKSAKS